MVVKDQLLSDVKAPKLNHDYLESPEVRAICLGNVGALYPEESFKKGNRQIVKALVENENHQLNSDEGSHQNIS